VIRLGPVALRMQIEELQLGQEYEEALALVDLLPDSQKGVRVCMICCEVIIDIPQEACANEINTKYAFELFRQGHYTDAMKHFTRAEFDVKQLLALYPALLPDTAQSYVATPFEANLGMLSQGIT